MEDAHRECHLQVVSCKNDNSERFRMKRRLKTGAFCLGFVSVLFCVIGTVLLIFGGIVRYGTDLTDQYMSGWYSNLRNALEKTGSHADLDTFHIGELEIIGEAALGVMATGLIVLVLGIIGIICACLRKRVLLITFAVLISLTLLATLAFIILLAAAKTTIGMWLADSMNGTIQTDYTGFNGSDIKTLGWNFLMVNLKCCGAHNYTDFWGASKWHREVEYSHVEDFTGKIEKQVPVMCCKMNASSSDNTNMGQCLRSPSAENAHITKGCYRALEEWALENVILLIIVVAAVIALQILLIVFTLCTCALKKVRKNYDMD